MEDHFQNVVQANSIHPPTKWTAIGEEMKQKKLDNEAFIFSLLHN